MGKRQHNHKIWSSRNPSTSTGFRFPQELITEILLRLPVKSLLNFKCVSKSWLSLISSPQFIKSHVSTSSREGEHLNHQLLFTTGNPIPGIKQCSLYAAFHEPSTQVFDIDYPSQSPDHPPRIVGVIDGLLCLAINRNAFCRSAEYPYYEHFVDYNDLFLWNPVLRKSKHLPNSNVGVEPRFKYVNHGFGYDELNDDYKVVTLITVSGSSGDYETEVNVYSLRADSWRRIGDLKGFLPFYDWGMYANGKIYWCGSKLGGDSYVIGKIVSLDMGSEKYGELQQPDYEPGDYSWNFKVVGGRPSVLCDYYYQAKADLWVMDKDGVEESWCKVVSIPYVDDVQSRYSPQKVLCILSNGEIVMINEFGLFVYHSKHKEFRNIELGLCDPPYYEVVEYVESLVSPNGSFV